MLVISSTVVNPFLHLSLRLHVTEDGRQALLNLAQGDMRRVINILQSTSMAFDVVNEENVYTCVGKEFTLCFITLHS